MLNFEILVSRLKLYPISCQLFLANSTISKSTDKYFSASNHFIDLVQPGAFYILVFDELSRSILQAFIYLHILPRIFGDVLVQQTYLLRNKNIPEHILWFQYWNCLLFQQNYEFLIFMKSVVTKLSNAGGQLDLHKDFYYEMP